MKVRVNRLGERFDNITEVVNGVVVANSVNNLATAVDSDKYMETDPVRLAAAEEGRTADAHAAEVMKDLLDKAEVAKVDDDPLATQDYRDRANTDIQNMYTMPVELEEGLNSAHGLILDEDIGDYAYYTPYTDKQWADMQAIMGVKPKGQEAEDRALKGDDGIRRSKHPLGSTQTVRYVLESRLFGDPEDESVFARQIFRSGKYDGLKAKYFDIIATFYDKAKRRKYKTFKVNFGNEKEWDRLVTKHPKFLAELKLAMKYFAEHPDATTYEKVDFSGNFDDFNENTDDIDELIKGRSIFQKSPAEDVQYPRVFGDIYDADRIGVGLPVGDGELAERLADLFDLDYKYDAEEAKRQGVQKWIWILIPEDIGRIEAKDYLTKVLGRKPEDWQTW